MKKVLITGADGFIGRYLLKNISKMDIDYRVICIQPCDWIESDRQCIADITKREEVERAFDGFNPDVIVHMAAIAVPDFKLSDLLYKVNVIGTENIIEVAKAKCDKKPKFIFMSTAGVYGNQEADFYHEDLPYKPENHYSYSKMICEMMLQNAKKHFDIRILRPFTIIGIGQTQGFFVSKLVKAFKAKDSLIKLGNIETERDYVDVDFCAKVISELIVAQDEKWEVYNVCTGVATRGSELIKFLEGETGIPMEVEISKEFIRDNEVWRLVGDPTRVEELMGKDKTATDYKDVIRDMLQE